MLATINRRRILQAIGVAALAPELVNSAQAATEPYHIFFNYGASEPPFSAKPIVDALQSTLRVSSRVTILSKAGTDLLVKTPAGVKEPQNRRISLIA